MDTKIVDVKLKDKKLFIKYAIKNIKNLDLTNLEQINEKYNKINKFIKNKLDPYEINNVLKMEKKAYEIQNFIKIRNKLILEKIKNTKLWKNNIETLKKEYKTSTKKEIEKSVEKLFKSYVRNWLGFWTLIEFDNNNLKNIHIFDLNDKNKLKKYLMKKY